MNKDGENTVIATEKNNLTRLYMVSYCNLRKARLTIVDKSNSVPHKIPLGLLTAGDDWVMVSEK